MFHVRTIFSVIIFFLFSFTYAQEFYDDPAGVRTFQNSRIGSSLLSPTTDYAALIKNDEEVTAQR
jgi:hypothetical protein